MFNRTTSTEFITPRLRQRTDQPQPKADRPQVDLAEPRCKDFLTADSRRLSQIRIRKFHRRDAEYAEENPFCPIGRRRLGKTYSSNLSHVFVCRRLPTNKKLILCALCASAVIFLKNLLFSKLGGLCAFARVVFYPIP